ncbi:hypothetical protein ACFSC4_06980 [Deinococcus malanensis]|uniref:hypothetical protein n=1 Tax=Deinococcus malanensis TaxID=1706855 RepID=UPI00363F048F
MAATILTATLTGGLWTQEVVDTFAFGGQLDAFGIQPRDPDSLVHVLSAPSCTRALPT